MRPAKIRLVARAARFTLLAGALCLLAQSGPSRDDYRAAYESWRAADPGLERDAGTAGEALAPRTAKAADAAAAYSAAHIAFLRDLSDRQAESLQWLRETEVQPLPELSPTPDLIRFANREIGAVSASAAVFAKDSDRALQQLRLAFETEQAALEALRAAVTDRQKANEKATQAAMAAEQARGKALEQYPFPASALAQSASLMRQEAAAWAAYYPALAEASRLAPTSLAPPVSGPPVSGPPVSSVPASNGQDSNLQSQAARAVASADPPRAPSITPLPLSRYVGVWGFQAGSKFFGSEPEFVDVAVHEENGHATGTFYARFKLPPGTGDPVVRFSFSGDFAATRIQTFALETGDGVKGTIDLIPGGPFNVLEVNFNTEVRAGKIHQGDVLLVKQ
jgi:hypothetical protein